MFVLHVWYCLLSELRRNFSGKGSFFSREAINQKCLCCYCLDDHGDDNNNHETESNLPPFLQKLRNLTRKLFSSSTTTKQSIEDALNELYSLETEKQKCESQLDDPKVLLEIIREELWVQLGGKTGDFKDTDEIFEIRVQQRYQERYEEWLHHHTRIMDRISILGDRLKSEYGIEAAAALRYIEANNTEEGEHETNEIEPIWKIAADNELSKREKDERSNKRKEEKRLEQKRGNNPKYLLEMTEDAEDLGSSDETDPDDSDNDDNDSEPDAYDNGWRNTPIRARKQDIKIAREAEDRRRVEEGKSRLIVRNKNNDMEEINEWDAGLKSSAMVVNKKMMMRKRTSTKTRTISLPIGTNSSASITKDDRERMRNDNHESYDDDSINIMVGRPKSLQPSSFVLSKNPLICIPEEFDRNLKEHQKEGIKFMYKNTFADLAGEEGANIGGCILAHSMGLGKFSYVLVIDHDHMSI